LLLPENRAATAVLADAAKAGVMVSTEDVALFASAGAASAITQTSPARSGRPLSTSKKAFPGITSKRPG
jgi:hypothetical protein